MHYKQCRTDLIRFQCLKTPCSMVWRGFRVSAVTSGETCCCASSGKATGTGYKQCRALNLLAVSQQARAGGGRRPYLLLAVTLTTKSVDQLWSVLVVKGFTFIK